MKNLFLTFSIKLIVLFILLLTVSCKEQETVAPTEYNTAYNNTRYNIKSGFLQNGGRVDYFLDDEADEKTHYNYNLFLTDGTPTFEGGEVVSMHDGEIIISATLLSPGITGFQTGLYEFDDWSTLDDEEEEEVILARYQNKHFFPLAVVYTDTDGDKNWEEEIGTFVTGGTIKITGTRPNYTTEYELTLAGNKTLKGRFSGKFNFLLQH